MMTTAAAFIRRDSCLLTWFLPPLRRPQPVSDSFTGLSVCCCAVQPWSWSALSLIRWQLISGKTTGNTAISSMPCSRRIIFSQPTLQLPLPCFCSNSSLSCSSLPRAEEPTIEAAKWIPEADCSPSYLSMPVHTLLSSSTVWFLSPHRRFWAYRAPWRYTAPCVPCCCLCALPVSSAVWFVNSQYDKSNGTW